MATKKDNLPLTLENDMNSGSSQFFIKASEPNGVNGFNVGAEFMNGTLIKYVVQIPLVLHGKVVTAVGTHPGEFAI